MSDSESKTKMLPERGITEVHRVESRGENGTGAVQKYAFSEKRKIGITGAVFLILNKMIGTGSTHHP